MASRRPPLDDFDDEDTIAESDIITPVDPPQCPGCGGLATLDDFDQQSLASFPPDHCARAADSHWWVCHNYSETHVKVVNYYRKR